jgi:heat shock protein HslJ
MAENNQSNQEKGGSSRKTRNILIAVIVILAVILLAVFIPLTFCSRQDLGDESPPPETTAGTEPEEETTDKPEEPKITDITWQWVRFTSGDGSEIIIDDPNQYSIVFREDGGVEIKADCNNALGTYKKKDSSLKISLGPTTLAECGEGSLYNQYLINLENIATYVLDGGTLYLNLKADAGNMVFRGLEVTPH